MIISRSPSGIVTISRWIFNCHIVPNAGRPFVVDPGMRSNAESAARYLSDVMHTRAGDIAFVTVTHGHTDHLSGAPRFIERTDAALYLPDRARAYEAGSAPIMPSTASIRHIFPVWRDQPFDTRGLLNSLSSARDAGYDGFDAWKCPNPIAGYLADRRLSGRRGRTAARRRLAGDYGARSHR